MHVQKT